MFSRLRERPERIESVEINFTMLGSKYKAVKKIIDATGCKDLGYVYKDDTVYISWKFDIEYYDAVRQLRAMTELLQDEEISTVSMTELNNMNILIVDMIDALREAETIIAKRTKTEKI